MFTSQWLISRKGPFGVIWIAAHCLKRLKKHELMQIDVPHSVENILEVGVPAVNHRILAFLLLGVVRVYSKKVEFLYHDCRDVLSNVGHLKGGKEVAESIEVLRKSYDLVSLPERFELDAFDLGILDDQNEGGKNVRSHEDISNPSDTPGRRKMRSNDKHHMVEDTACSELYTPVRDVFSPCFVKGNLDVAMLCGKSYSKKSSIETLCGKFFSEERLEPFKYAEKELGYDMLYSASSNSANLEFQVHPDTEVIPEEEHDEIRLPDEEVRNLDNSCGIGGHVSEEQLEESLGFEDMGEEPDFALLSKDRFRSDGETMKHVDSTVNIEEPDDFINPSFEEEGIGVKKRSQSVTVSVPKKKQPLSINTDLPSDSKFPAAPDNIAVRTPATKEKASRLLKKRKCVCDETVVLPNKEIKQMIEDSSGLVCKRRKAPHTVSQAWKARKISSLLEPLIPCTAADYGLITKLKTTTAMDTDTQEVPSNQVSSKSLAEFGSEEETPIAPGMQVCTKSLATFGSDEEAPIAPGTPVTHLTSLRMQEGRGLSRCDALRRSSSFDSFEELFEAQEVDGSSTDKVVTGQEKEDASAGCEVKKKHEYSGRTRKVASYLVRQLGKQRKLRGEDGMVEVTQIVESKSKGESARLLYEILVLKSGDYIQVKQEKAYGEIWLEETPKLKELLVGSLQSYGI